MSESSSNTVVIDESLFLDVIGPDDDSANLASFTRRLRGTLRGATVVPMPGLELSQSLEAMMKLARHRFETAPALLEACELAPPEEAAAAGMELCEETMALAIWLRNLDTPWWVYGQVNAPRAFQAHARAAARAGLLRRAVHWTVACCIVPATRLGTPGIAMNRDDIQRLVDAEAQLGPSTVHDEIQAWHDLFASYRLFR